MSRLQLGFACAVVLAGAGTLRAQPPVPGGSVSRPTFSPYLNLNRAGTPAAVNYYGLVRPELQFRQSIQNLQGAVAANQQAIGVQAEVTGMVSATGHPTQFLNYGGYFLNSGPSLGSRSGPAGTPRPATPTIPTLPPGGAGARKR